MSADPAFLSSGAAAEAYLSAEGWNVPLLSRLAAEVCFEPLPGRAIQASERAKLLRAIARLEAAIPRLNQSWPVRFRRLSPIPAWEFENYRRLLAAQSASTRLVEKSERNPRQRFAVKMLGETLIATGRLMGPDALAACAVLTSRLSEVDFVERVQLATAGIPSALSSAAHPVERPAKATTPKVRRRVVRNEAGTVIGIATSATARGRVALLKAWRRRHELALPHVERLLEQSATDLEGQIERYEATAADPYIEPSIVQQERYAQTREWLARIEAARDALRSAPARGKRA